jgi:hypothetical protein
MIGKLYERTVTPSSESRIEIFTDGNDDYTYVLPNYYDVNTINYGQLVKVRENGKVVDKERRVVYGNPEDIETNNIENFNGILRERIGRLVRKTKCFSKRKSRLESALHIFQFYWNFMNNFRRGKSPAMLEELTDHLWTWNEFFYFKLSALD